MPGSGLHPQALLGQRGGDSTAQILHKAQTPWNDNTRAAHKADSKAEKGEYSWMCSKRVSVQSPLLVNVGTERVHSILVP